MWASVCGCVLSMAKWVTLICTAKQISASQTREMSFVFKDAGRVAQQRWYWKTAERERGRGGQSLSQAQGNVTQLQEHSPLPMQVTNTLILTHTHSHPAPHAQLQRAYNAVARGYEKLFYGCFYCRLHLSSASVCLRVASAYLFRLRHHSAKS